MKTRTPLIALALLFLCIGASTYADNIQVGDQIRILLPGEQALERPLQVDRQGNIHVPEVGAIQVAGFTESELQPLIALRMQSIYRDLKHLKVFVSQKQLLINVQGYVKKPGEYTLASNASVQVAIHAAGGLRSGAQMDRVQLLRGGEKQLFDYKAFLDSGDFSRLPNLQSLDTLFIPASPMIGNVEREFDPAALADGGDAAEDRKAIKVFGEVNRPGSFSYKQSMSLVDILMRAGGVTRYAGVEQIRVISDQEPKLFNLKRYLDSGDEQLLPTMVPGATIFVPRQEEEIKSGANTIYIMGEVAHPGAYEGKQGATFMDILANAGGPTRFAESRQIRVLKASGEVIRFDLSGYTEGTVAQQPPSIRPGDAIFVPEKTDMNEKSWLKVAPDRAVRIIGEVVRPGRIEWSDEMSLLDLLAHVGGPTSRADTSNIEVVSPQSNGGTRTHIFDLDRFIQSGGHDRELPVIRAGAIVRVHDLPQDPSDNKSQWVRQSSERSIYVFGQVGAPGRYRFTEDMHFLDILSAADGPTMDADIHNIRVTHRGLGYAKVSKLNLSMYFETGDESILPHVRPGDTIYIPEKNKNWLDRSKESTVRVLGEVRDPGRYVFNDNMTVLDLLAEAGGPTDNAYLEKISVVNMSCCQGQARTFDLVNFSKTANIYELPVIRAGDTIYIPHKDESFVEKARAGLRDILQITTTIVLIGAL